STTSASRSAWGTTARGRSSGATASRRRPGRRSTCTPATTTSTPWPMEFAGPRSSSELCEARLMQLESMYQEIILEHYKNPHGRGLREPFEAEGHHVNPTGG